MASDFTMLWNFLSIFSQYSQKLKLNYFSNFIILYFTNYLNQNWIITISIKCETCCNLGNYSLINVVISCDSMLFKWIKYNLSHINLFWINKINFEIDESFFCSEHESKINQLFCFVPHDDINLQFSTTQKRESRDFLFWCHSLSKSLIFIRESN